MRYVPIYCEKFSASSLAIEIIELAICSINYVTLTLIERNLKQVTQYIRKGANIYSGKILNY